MILLILDKWMDQGTKIAPLNSIMILLIRKKNYLDAKILAGFKFHYDSINSYNAITKLCKLYIFKFHYDSINSEIIRVTTQFLQ